MKLYKISVSSEYVDWDILHNQQGYSTSATTPVTWKSSLGNTWGETVANGYMEPTAASGWATKGFCLGKRGWHNMDDMANIYYVWPDVATSAKARHDTWGESDVAVWDYDGTHTLYLVQKELEEGWMDEDTFAERGWEIVPDVPLGELVFVDASTGDVVYSVESLNEMVFAPTGYFTIEDTGDIVFVEQSPYPIVSHFHVDFDTVQTLADGAYIDTVLPYYTSKLYIAGIVDRVAETVVDFGLTVSNEGGYVRVTNNTGASVTLTRLAIQSMDAAGAEVVEVVDRQDNHAYAFKWDDGGTPYWWISYSGERHWTDTLGNWSEVPSVVLPTVSVGGDFGTKNWLWRTNGGTVMSIDANSQEDLWYPGSGGYVNIPYDTSKAYAVLLWYYDTGSSDIGQNGVLSIANNLGQIAARNNTSSYVNLYALRCAVCSSNQATVVTVYNSSNVAYNAFKFTANGTDYYYVLDGTQTDWTDDLAGIGYHLISVAYLGAGDVTVRYNTWFWLYLDPSGSQSVPFDANTSYTFDSAYLNNGTQVNVNANAIFMGRPGSSYTGLALRSVSSAGFTAYKIYYHAVSTVQ